MTTDTPTDWHTPETAADPVPSWNEPALAVSDPGLAARRATAASLCGLMAARNHRYDEAADCFTEAVALDARIELTALSRFWELPRGGQEAAVRAYERVGRVRDASALAAWLRWTYRPRPLPRPIRRSTDD